MIPKSDYRFSTCAKPGHLPVLPVDASAGEPRSEKIMLQNKGYRRAHLLALSPPMLTLKA
jgi:hypothetical protein